jgi:anti-sigma B factor antagonist
VSDPGDFAVRVTAGAAGEAIVAVVGEFEQALVEAVRGGQQLVVDLTGCTFLSSTGLRALLEADREREEGARPIAVVAPDPHIRKVLEIAGVDALFELAERYDEPGLDAGSRAVS